MCELESLPVQRGGCKNIGQGTARKKSDCRGKLYETRLLILTFQMSCASLLVGTFPPSNINVT